MGKSVYQDKHLTRPSSPSPATLSTLFLLLGTQMAPVASICVWGREPSGMHWAHHAYRGWFLRGLEPSSATRGQQPHPQPPLLDHLVSLDFSCCPTPPSHPLASATQVDSVQNLQREAMSCLNWPISFSTYQSATCWHCQEDPWTVFLFF